MPPRETLDNNRRGNNNENAGGEDGFAKIWRTINEKLRQLGLNDFEVYGFLIEPAHLLVAALSLIFFGPLGLVLIAIAIYVTQSSRNASASTPTVAAPSSNPFHRQPSHYQQQQTQPPPRNSSGSASSRVFSGTGQRLGS